MKVRLIFLSLLAILNVALWFMQSPLENIYLTRAFFSALALLIIYVIIKVIIEKVIADSIKEPKTRYSMKRIASMLFFLLLLQ